MGKGGLEADTRACLPDKQIHVRIGFWLVKGVTPFHCLEELPETKRKSGQDRNGRQE